MTKSNEAAVRSEDAYDWSVDLHQRLTAAKSEDTVRGMFISGTLDVVRTLEGNAAVQHCMKAAEVQKVHDFFSYPVSMHLKLTQAAAEALRPRFGGFDEALRQLGKRGTTDFLSSSAGKTLRLLTGSKPKLMVNSIPGAYRASVSYGERTVTWTGPTSGRITMVRDFMPWPYHEGVLQALFDAIEARNPRIHTHRRALLEGDYAFSWEG